MATALLTRHWCGALQKCAQNRWWSTIGETPATAPAVVDKHMKLELPPEPTTCCGSGCQNCVWVQYAAEVSKIYQDGGERARQIILDKITDPNLRMFIEMELKLLRKS